MKKTIIVMLLVFAALQWADAEVDPGDDAIAFSLKNVDGTTISLSDYIDQKGIILVFTCNQCPFANAYEERIIRLNQNFAGKGFPVVAINPNDDGISPEDTFEKMKAKAIEKAYPFPYLKDEAQKVYKAYGATRTPQIFLLQNQEGKFKVAYIGAIDDNAMEETLVNTRYVEKAIAALLAGIQPDPTTTIAIGCTIKSRM